MVISSQALAGSQGRFRDYLEREYFSKYYLEREAPCILVLG